MRKKLDYFRICSLVKIKQNSLRINLSNGLENGKEPRTIGLSMIPGQHIVSIDVDERTQT